MKNDLQSVVEELGRAFDLGTGPIPLERLVALHLGAFRNFRARGLTWEQISRLLVRAGVVRPDGRPFGAAHLRGIYARQLKRHRRPAPSAREHSRATDPGHAGERAEPMVSRSSASWSGTVEVAGNERRRDRQPHMNGQDQHHDGHGARLTAGGLDEQETRPSAGVASGGVALRDALRRAAAARKTQR